MSASVSVRLLLTQSDERLVGYARAGHERAFEALVQRYRRQLLGYCRRLLLSEPRAEDALQQGLLQAWVALRDGTEVRDVRPWLHRIVHNAAVNTLRVSRYDYCQLSESLRGADAPQADLDRRIAVREALAGLAALPEMQREALLRTAVEGRSHQQVATDLGLSEPALRGLVYRARASLRAAAGAIVPPPLLGWALEAGSRGTPVLEQVAGLGAGGGTAGLAGLLLKGAAVAATAGALAGGIVAHHDRHAARNPALAKRARAKSGAGAGIPTAAASTRTAAFTRADGSSNARRQPATGASHRRWQHRRGLALPSAPMPATSPPTPRWSHPSRHEDHRHQGERRLASGDGKDGGSGGRADSPSDGGSSSRHGGPSGRDNRSGDGGLRGSSGPRDSSGSRASDSSRGSQPTGGGEPVDGGGSPSRDSGGSGGSSEQSWPDPRSGTTGQTGHGGGASATRPLAATKAPAPRRSARPAAASPAPASRAAPSE